MNHYKLLRITTVPMSLEKLLEGQLEFMQNYFEITAISADKERLEALGKTHGYSTYHIEMTRQITPWQDLKAVAKLYNYLKQEKPAIVHTHTPKAGIVGMLAAKLAGVPLRLHTVAGLPLMEATGFKCRILNSVEKLTYACATQVYPNSKGLYDFIVREKLASIEKMKIIGQGSSNGIDTAHFNPELYDSKQNEDLREKLNIKKDDFVFVFIGRLVRDKGINELVEAFRGLETRGKQSSTPHNLKPNTCHLLLVGPLETELDPLLEETLLEIEQNPQIISMGYQDDVRPYLALSNALVFPSYREGFPNVVMQAGAMGLPAIVTDINGCNEIVEAEKNGIIIPSKNIKALQKAMAKLMQDNSLYKKLQQHARPMIVDRFQREDVWKALLNEYQTLLKEKD